MNLLSNSGQTVAAKEIAADVQQTLFAPIPQQQVNLIDRKLFNSMKQTLVFLILATVNAILQPKQFPMSS